MRWKTEWWKTAPEKNKGKRIKRTEENPRDSGTTLNVPTFALQGLQRRERKTVRENI